MVKVLEAIIFKTRLIILLGLAVFTVICGYYAVQLRMTAGFDKQLPVGHEYIQTFQEYREKLFGSNRIIVVLEAKEGTIWNKDFFQTYKNLTDDIFFLPGVARHTVTSLWTPNTRYLEITEEGINADDVIGGTVTAETMTEEDLENVENNVIRGGFVGRLVAEDFSAAMIVAELLEVNPQTQKQLDYFDLAAQLESEIRDKYEVEGGDYNVRIIGFAKLIGDIADGAQTVIIFFSLAFVLTVLAVYLYSRSAILTFLPLFCSLTSLVWQFGILHFLGYGLDPLAILVPFLVFAIGVSHGIQQINLITAEISRGASAEEAAHSSFTGLLIPGSMALVTDLVGFGTLYMIPIPMIQELAVTASIGVALKIVTNLIMLPVLASLFTFDEGFSGRVARAREFRMKIMNVIGKVAYPKVSIVVFIVSFVLFIVAVIESQNRFVGALHPGSPELRDDARYNVDSNVIANKFALGLNLLTVVVETPTESCIKYPYMEYLNRFSWYMQNVDGVSLVMSLPYAAKTSSSGWNEGNLKWQALPRNQFALVQAVGPVAPSTGLLNQDCSVLSQLVYLEDAKAKTIERAVHAVEEFRANYPMEGVNIRLASGNMGVQAAVNNAIEEAEVPMLLWVYVAIVSLVILTYRDWRATVACTVPLTFATFFGYWFMKELEIGLTVATLPVIVLAVGLGVDYAFYIYNRVQFHLSEGLNITDAYQETVHETGMAVVFTALTMAIGVSTWTFSPLKFQADMGLLLSFMFMTNMLMAMTTLPSIAVILDMLFPRKKPVKAPSGAVAH
ncbi:efflux RND transporter permease subunit [Tepidicaulis sp. LMO-SS28]|uniref:efflux RND transporter permease subunit n=1 Tax=Tepidicaulis sp. LMO-SS28 TaxID=3447455 RepID=UPI003EE0845B